ncbi:phage tail tape measure protein [Yokenella regensburgei]|uniref:phage tail tape measure protein n=1 Tax=Yokenella regensburgei TaxID=158877 RepID=UPI003EDA199E
MSREFDTQIKFGVQDNATPKIRSLSEEFRRMSGAREAVGIRSEHSIQREISRTIAAYNRLERGGVMSAKEQERAYQRMQSSVARLRQEMGETLRAQEKMNPALQEYRRQAQARETLGIRSEQSVRREISQTLAAYNRLSRSGTMSASEQSRALSQTQAMVAKLRRELGETERSYSRLARAGKVAAAIGGGIVATTAVLRKPIENYMQYDSELRTQANFAYSSGSKADREAGMKVIDAGVRKALREGGGDHDGALRALETMQRSGTMGKGPDMSIRALPEVMKISTATETDPAAVASLQASAFNFGLNEKDAHAALSTATTMSQHGAVNMSLLAKMGPEALESAKSAGWYGRKGYSETLALFEATARGANAEHPEMAATYTTNLLSELSSPTLANNFSRLEHGRGKSKKGIDIRALIRADAAKGLSPLDTVDRAIRSIDEHDPQFVALEKKIAGTTDPDEKAQLVARRDQIHGQNVGKIFTNEYSRLGFLNWERNKDYYHELVKEGNEQFEKPEGETSADMDFALKRDSTEFKVNQAKNEAFNAQIDTAAPLAKAFGDVAEKAAELAQEFPKLTTAVSGMYSAIQGIGAIGGMGLGGAAAIGGKKLWSIFRGGSAVAAEGAEIATSGVKSGGGSLLSRAGSMVGRGGRWVGGLVEDGLLARGAGLVNPWTVGALALMPGNTVGNSDEMSELARLKHRNQERNSAVDLPVALDAMNEMRRFMEQHNQSRQGPTTGTGPQSSPAQAQPFVANIYLDSRQVTEVLLRNIELDSRRR